MTDLDEVKILKSKIISLGNEMKVLKDKIALMDAELDGFTDAFFNFVLALSRIEAKKDANRKPFFSGECGNA